MLEWKASQCSSLAYAQSNKWGPRPFWTIIGLKINSPASVLVFVRLGVRISGADKARPPTIPPRPAYVAIFKNFRRVILGIILSFILFLMFLTTGAIL
ncbi:MAG: hypothetical protein BWX60_00546 [Candidatus Marinimicrobia bacterium ADurb.Bin030]|nr:MAG: hypothetical protein BWX60_00546 [Candidatus Marinimicrobia bacterium ADurb.Bin030]